MTHCCFFRDLIRKRHIPLLKQIPFYKYLHCAINLNELLFPSVPLENPAGVTSKDHAFDFGISCLGPEGPIRPCWHRGTLPASGHFFLSSPQISAPQLTEVGCCNRVQPHLAWMPFPAGSSDCGNQSGSQSLEPAGIALGKGADWCCSSQQCQASEKQGWGTERYYCMWTMHGREAFIPMQWGNY